MVFFLARPRLWPAAGGFHTLRTSRGVFAKEQAQFESNASDWSPACRVCRASGLFGLGSQIKRVLAQPGEEAARVAFPLVQHRCRDRLANEGALVLFVPEEQAEAALAAMRSTEAGRDAAIIGRRRRDWPPGALIPGEEALAQEFGVARATVNRALSELARAGVLERRRKAGTRVAAGTPVVAGNVSGRPLMARTAR